MYDDDDSIPDDDALNDRSPYPSERGPLEFIAAHPYFHLHEYALFCRTSTRRSLDYHVARGRIVSVRRGTYAWRSNANGPDPYLLASRLVGDLGTIAYESALAFHQNELASPKRVIVISRYRLSGFVYQRVTYQATQQPHRLSPERITSGGVNWETRQGLRLDVCTPERAFVDCLHRHEFGPGLDALWSWLWDQLKPNVSAIAEYAMALGDRPTIARVGLLLERHPGVPKQHPALQELMANKPTSTALMDPNVPPRDCFYSPWWRLRVPSALHGRLWPRR